MASTQIPAVITYHKPGTQPPLYVAGTFSDPPWQPYEMDYTTRGDGDYNFRKEVRGEPGSKIQYKFRIGDGDWWVLRDDGPTITDSNGNTNHVLEVKPQEEASRDQPANPQDAQDRQNMSTNKPPTYAKVAAKHLQGPSEAAAADRSKTGTPVFAKVAAEVADSAELLHEEVPERERPRRMSEEAETAAEVADTAETLDKDENTILILEPPPGEGRPFEVHPRDEGYPDDQEGYIADKSPLFAHECVGLYELSDDDLDQEDVAVNDDAQHGGPVGDVDDDNIDLNDPTLERFPSNREDIIDAVRKLETGLQADQADFEGSGVSPIVNPSRRGTEDITGDFLLGPPQASSPPARRDSKRSAGGSVGSIPAISLHSISEAEELAEEEISPRPAVVFSNPLKRKPKHLKIPTSDEDEGIALPDGVSPRTVKPAPRISTPEASPPHSPLSPRTTRKDDHFSRAQNGPSQAAAAKDSNHPEGPSYAQVAAPGPTGAEGTGKGPSAESQAQSQEPGEGETAASQPPSSEAPSANKDTTTQNPSYAQVAAPGPTGAEDAGKGPSAESQAQTQEPGEGKTAASQPPNSEAPGTDKDTTTESPNYAQVAAPESTPTKEPSYAEVAAPEPTPTKEPSYAEVAAPEPTSTKEPSYAQVAAPEPTPAEEPSDNKATPPTTEEPTPDKPASPTTKAPTDDKPPTEEEEEEEDHTTRPHPPTTRRLSYAEVAASKPPTTSSTDEPPSPKSKSKTKPSPAPAGAPASTAQDNNNNNTTTKPTKPSTTTTSTTSTTSTTTVTAHAQPGTPTPRDAAAQQLRRRSGAGAVDPQHQQQQQQQESGSGGSGVNVPAVMPKHGGVGWIRALFRVVFVDWVGGVVRRVMRMFGLRRREG